MALDMQGRRAEGVSPLPADATRGSRGKGNDAGDAPYLPTSALDEQLDAPGNHVNRGMEANTNLFGSDSAPMIDTVTAGERPNAGMPFDTPDSSARISTDPSHSDWDDAPWNTADVSARNTRPLVIPHDSFTEMGEPPYTKGQPDGRT